MHEWICRTLGLLLPATVLATSTGCGGSQPAPAPAPTPSVDVPESAPEPELDSSPPDPPPAEEPVAPAPEPQCDGLAEAPCNAATGCAWNQAGEFSACFPSDPEKKCAVGTNPKMCGLLSGCLWDGDVCAPNPG